MTMCSGICRRFPLVSRPRLAVILLGLWFVVGAGLSPALAESEKKVDVDLSQEKALAFAKAQREVNRIYSRSDLVDGNSPIKIEPDALPKDVWKAMIGAIKSEGLTLDEYNALMDAYRSHEGFRSRVVAATVQLF